jgi:NAD(P)-dependent dehydrogenase (short-subunit alcohol dehydrogenase family)
MHRINKGTTMANKTLFITGVSSGFGRAIAEQALERGHTVHGTVRRLADAESIEKRFPDRFTAHQVDVTDEAGVSRVVDDIERKAAVDVVINNAGYGHEGILEESPMSEIRSQFDVNVYGAVAVTKAFLPHMRSRRSGHIINITSMGGFITMPGIAYYCGSKFALQGISEVLSKELSSFGIHVTAVAPGSFRTDWAGRSMVRSARSIADYDVVMDPIRTARIEKSGRQLGDPDRAATAIVALADAPHPPAHLLLGSDALRLVRAKLDALRAEIDEWEAVTVSTDG